MMKAFDEIPPLPAPIPLAGEAWETAFDELFDSFPSGSISDDAFDRESIYTREDEW